MFDNNDIVAAGGDTLNFDIPTVSIVEFLMTN